MERKNKIINFIKALIIIAVATVIVIGANKILLLKSQDGISQLQSLYKQPENSIDVIFSGSSKIYCDVATGVLWEKYGIAAYDLGGAEAPSWVSYYQIKEALRTQRPKVICYEVSVTAMYSWLVQANNWASDNAYGMKWSSNRIDMLKVNSDEDDFYPRLNPYNIMHGRYKDLCENDFTNVNNSVNYKGFYPRERIEEFETPDVSGITETTPCSEKEEEYIRKIIELARSEDIPLILIVSPYVITEDEQKIINYVGQLASSENVRFIDFNRKYEELGMDFSTDMADSGHLSPNGTYKYAMCLGSLRREEYDVPDRRGDDRYVSWDWDAALQNYERNDQIIRRSGDAAEVLEHITDGYVVFLINGEAANIIYNNEVVDKGEGDFRLMYKLDGDSFLFEKRNDKGKDVYALFINDDEYVEDYNNVMIIYDAVRHEYVSTVNF